MTYLVHHSGIGRGWFVLSHPYRDRVAIQTEAGPYLCVLLPILVAFWSMF